MNILNKAEMHPYFSGNPLNLYCKQMQTEIILRDVPPSVLAAGIIDLDNIVFNYNHLKELVGVEKNIEISAVVKANAYGFGILEVAYTLYNAGCRKFFVANIEEGIKIAEILPVKPFLTDNCDIDGCDIFVLCGALPNCCEILFKHNLTPVLTNVSQIEDWNKFSLSVAQKLPAVLHVDSGISRNGLSEKEAIDYSSFITKSFNLKFLMSHLACADIPEHPMNELQYQCFNRICNYYVGIKKCFCNTNGIFLGEKYHCDIIRPGKSLYGFAVRKDLIGSFKPVLGLYSRIVQINHTPAGQTVGYGATFVTAAPSILATVGIGYADGFMRKFASAGYGYLYGTKARIVGRISMDYVVLDITNINNYRVNIGDWVTFADEKFPLEIFADEMETLPHEISCRLGTRIKRIYKGGSIAL